MSSQTISTKIQGPTPSHDRIHLIMVCAHQDDWVPVLYSFPTSLIIVEAKHTERRVFEHFRICERFCKEH
jgi:hypothetical protein